LTLFEGVILGLIQGLSEFLPISSSGHLAVLQHFFGIEGENVLTFAVLLHLGTLISLIAVYYKVIWELILELLAVIKDILSGKGLQINKNTNRKLGVMIIAASIPTGIIAMLFNDLFAGLYNSLPAIGVSLLLTGCFLWQAERMNQKGKNVGEAKYRDALFVGLCQGIAIIPGISRSGATILGAALLEIPEAFAEGFAEEMLLPIVAGVAAAAISGYIAIRTMIRVVCNKKLYIFSLYTWIAGSLLLIYTFMN